MTKKEINILKTIVKEYADIDSRMRANEELLKKLSAEQTELMGRLENNELKEKEFMSSISKKYPNVSLGDLIQYL